MDLIADTNVWYDIGGGRRDPQVIKSSGRRLVATPTSLLEISSLIDHHNLADRRKAAQAAVEHADVIADDCEYHLSCLWGLHVQNPNIPWGDAFKAVAQALTVTQLQGGVADFSNMVRRKVNVPLARAWRIYHWDDFRNKVVDVIDQYVPGYKVARGQGKVKHLNKRDGHTFANDLRSPNARKTIVKGTFWRALMVVGEPPREPSDSEYNHAEPLVSPYVNAYIEYLIGCATTYAPQSNDLGDSECFLYLQGDAAFLSSDKRWVSIARMVCPDHFCDPENKVP